MIFKILDYLPLMALLFLAILFATAPMEPEPHLLEKLRMLSQGTLQRPVDIFDLLMHSSGLLLLAAKLARMFWLSRQKKDASE